MNMHTEVRVPFSSRVRAKAGQGPRYNYLLPDPKVLREKAKPLADDPNEAGISLGEAMWQLVDRCLEQVGEQASNGEKRRPTA
ncbi:hypothetical protein [Xanthomonas euroxanthea]|uniref:hypothetical protein n=1 Tax=Xanthomonas euroxanthea TaxID=2259622 RepID=UPI00141A7221|nr:hypothetical protein [Xanthomonas euroxanthea]